jgi:DNA-binding GntR family transcriptional regulator
MSTDTKIDQAASILRKRILDGFYVVGQRLPSERELAEELEVSRPTIRAALLRLQVENLIDIVPRGGSIVRTPASKVTMGPSDPKAKGLELKRAGSFIRAMQKEGKQVIVRFLEPSSIIPMGQEISEKMQDDPSTEVLRRYRVHLVDRVPYRILDSYYLASLLGGLLGHDDNYYPLFKWLRENKGVRPIHGYEKLNIRMPSAEEAAILNISRNQPVVEMDRWVWGVHEDRPEEEILFEYTKNIANAALHEFAYDYDIDEEACK